MEEVNALMAELRLGEPGNAGAGGVVHLLAWPSACMSMAAPSTQPTPSALTLSTLRRQLQAAHPQSFLCAPPAVAAA